MTDAELLRAWHSGDRAAGEALFERHYEPVRRFFRNKVREPAELVQRTFVACLEQAERFRGDASFRTFLFAIANNLLRKHYRELAGPRGRVELGTVSAEDLRQSPSRELQVNEEKRLLLRALRRLSVDQQVLLELHYWEKCDPCDPNAATSPVFSDKALGSQGFSRGVRLVATGPEWTPLGRARGDGLETAGGASGALRAQRWRSSFIRSVTGQR